MVKPQAEYTVTERENVVAFQRLQELRHRDFAALRVGERSTLDSLTERETHGEIDAIPSYLDLDTFYIVYALLIAGYTALGGLLAIAIIDVIQGILIVFLSLILIPIALNAIGGISGMHDHIPQQMFSLFGTSAASDYTWYFVASFALLNLVVNAPKSFTIGGAARDEGAARIGFITGSIFKRIMMIAWAFTGLLAVGLYARTISDPTTVWGTMTHDLLGAGAIGLMIAAIFSANMDGNATAALDASASVIKNIYLPMSRSATERSQMIVGRFVLVFVLFASVFMARWMVNSSIADIFRNMLSVLSTIGPAFWLVYFWRRLTTTAVAVQMSVSIAMTVVLTFFAPLAFPAMRTDPALTLRTAPAIVTSQRPATTDDVKAGLATTVGTQITVNERIPPAAVYFESMARSRRGDTTSPWKGEGPFRPQIWLLSRLGIDFSTWRKPAIKSARCCSTRSCRSSCWWWSRSSRSGIPNRSSVISTHASTRPPLRIPCRTPRWWPRRSPIRNSSNATSSSPAPTWSSGSRRARISSASSHASRSSSRSSVCICSSLRSASSTNSSPSSCPFQISSRTSRTRTTSSWGTAAS